MSDGYEHPCGGDMCLNSPCCEDELYACQVKKVNADCDVERVTHIAETSESLQAITLAAEVRRLQAFEQKVKDLLEAKKERLISADAAYAYAYNNDLSSRLNEASHHVRTLEKEIAVLEGLFA